ncbi:hypothetical protein HPP92_020933 [Vanilla planifolia]|uniref:Uncharacterized protein n=1 Tax=Vanilla planifolia TaxID=51239 RepID=A0A835PY72_VANPL|nr:hypothetical protein HPP92_020933 [Vanilla planifolia]
MMMVEEMVALFKVSFSTLVLMAYSRFMAARTTRGFRRLVSILPVIAVLFFLPSNFPPSTCAASRLSSSPGSPSSSSSSSPSTPALFPPPFLFSLSLPSPLSPSKSALLFPRPILNALASSLLPLKPSSFPSSSHSIPIAIDFHDTSSSPFIASTSTLRLNSSSPPPLSSLAYSWASISSLNSTPRIAPLPSRTSGVGDGTSWSPQSCALRYTAPCERTGRRRRLPVYLHRLWGNARAHVLLHHVRDADRRGVLLLCPSRCVHSWGSMGEKGCKRSCRRKGAAGESASVDGDDVGIRLRNDVLALLPADNKEWIGPAGS